MLNIRTLVLGDYQTNCYIVWQQENTRCCVIDPGYSPELILKAIEEQGLELEAILLTHGHFDHVGAVRALAAETECRVFIHEAELSLPPMLTAGTLYYTDLYNSSNAVETAGIRFEIRHTPGHTPGSVCLITGDVMFSGDTLFAGSCGRTDLPGGSLDTISRSLKALASIPEELRVYPGHGSATSLAVERVKNPYISYL